MSDAISSPIVVVFYNFTLNLFRKRFIANIEVLDVALHQVRTDLMTEMEKLKEGIDVL